jgi:heme/copper-type cytochrome/quinol oxidase subunit 2
MANKTRISLGTMSNLPPFVAVALYLILLFNALLYYGLIFVPVAWALNNTAEIANIPQSTPSQQQTYLLGSIVLSIGLIAAVIVVPLLYNMFLTFRQGRQTTNEGTTIRPLTLNQLYRLLVAIGVILTVILIIVYLNSLIWYSITAVLPTQTITALVEVEKNFVTIVGTAFASLVAFYFGARATQGSNGERKTPGTRQVSNGGGGTTQVTGESGQKALLCIHVNPIKGSVGVEIDSQVTATFSTAVRSSTISNETFSIKDDKGNPVQGKFTLTDNNTTIVFTPVPTFNGGTRYTVTIKKSIMDISGASMATDMEWHFTTTG